MTHSTRQFAVVKPQDLQGDPFEVAGRAVRQAESLARILAEAAEDARIMARNAEMERQLLAGDEPDAIGFDDTAQGKKLAAAVADAQRTAKELSLVAKAAEFNPKARV